MLAIFGPTLPSFDSSYADPRLKAADLRLQRTYGISLDEYEKLLAFQDGTCAICGRPPFKFRLNVDHDHRFDRTELRFAKKENGEWQGCSVGPDNVLYTWIGTIKAEGRINLRLQLRRASVRGLLCFQCNKGLAYYRDLPERFEAASIYLRAFIKVSS